ncbi:ATP-binding protein [Candidatus Entotheonella palauensis]|nr:ATP-binding protein [Candidatus Entotheonella palauensis]
MSIHANGQSLSMLSLASLLAWLSFLLPLGQPPAWSASAPHRVLVLNAYHIGMKWEDRIIEGLLSTLQQSELPLDIFIEYMDTKRIPRELLFPELASLYAKKYTSPIDVIIVADDNALDFMLEYRQTLFPGVPVVFCGINDYTKAHHIHKLGYTGLTETVDIKRTLELILELHPNTKQVLAVADAATTSALNLNNYRAATVQIATQVEFGELSHWTFDELGTILATLPSHTVLLYLSVSRDREGNLPPPSGGTYFLAEHAAVPLYTLWETHGLGDGFIGGFVADGVLHGRRTAELALRILQGEPIQNLPVVDNVGNRPIFDYHALMKHNLSIKQLPASSLILNEPQSFYYRYYKQIWATFSFLILQSMIIAVLLYLINKVRRRERSILQDLNTKLERRVSERTEELELRTQELERFNNELDQFTYVASHDLQEPLRNLISYSTLLREDLGEELSKDAGEDLYYITSSAERMKHLVQDLLALSRAGRAAVKKEPVSLDDCLENALDALRMRVEETHAMIHRQTLPVILGDATLLTQLYQNLLGNALKFVGDKQPEIELTAEQTGDMWTLGIRDNGIGIESEYAEHIFKPFKRLHGMAEHDGTGIGLSICQKAVERHGGRIWVDSRPGEGCYFQFTLPVMVAEQEPRHQEEEACHLPLTV